MTTLFILLNRRFLIVDNGSKNSSLLISLENLALILPFATLPLTSLCMFKYSGLARLSKPRPTIPDKIFGTKWSNSVKLDRKKKVWYLFLRAFKLLFVKSKFLKGD